VAREDWKIRANVFDQFTLKVLHDISHKGHFDDINQALQVGKEANVFIASKGSERVAVKIYRLENCNFNKMFDYIKSDPRFPSIARRKREIVFAWTLREYRNLLVARQAGVRVPTPLFQKNNVLVEEFLGDDLPAPQLKNVHLSEKEAELCYDEIVLQMRLLHHKAKIVHADLSEFNILYHNSKPFLIDFSQATSIKDQRALEYLQRDSFNIDSFFRKENGTTYKRVIAP
jgi:RIO kinase 1